MAKKNSGDISKESLKAVDDFIKKTEAAKKNVSAMNDAFGNIATQLFGISGAAFFKEVPKTTEEIIKQKEELSKMAQDVTSAWENIGDLIKDKFTGLEGSLKGMAGTMSGDLASGFEKVAKAAGFKEQVSSLEDILKLEQKYKDIQAEGIEDWDKYKDNFEELTKLKKQFRKEEADYFKNNKEHYDKILEAHPEFMKGLNEQERIQALMQIQQKGINGLQGEHSSILQDIVYHSSNMGAANQEVAKHAGEITDKFRETSAEVSKSTKGVFSLGEGVKSVVKNFASGIIPSVLEFDQAISDAGKNFGFVGMKSVQTSAKMAELGQSAAKFNMSMGDAVNMMGGLGEELATINEVYLAGAVEQFAAIEKATGISADETNKMAGEMMRAGKSAEDVHDFIEGTNKFAKLYGVNSKKALSDISRNMDKMRQMGFEGGEESLSKMVLTANRLRMDVDEIFDMASKARNIEGAMDMAAELQLAGGSFAAINPMDLLAAARKGPGELTKILSTMGDDIGAWNEETGAYEFDPIDVDRLQIMADATDVSLDSMQKMIQKNAEDAKKADFMPDMQLKEVMGPDGKPLDQDMMNNMLLDSVDINGKALEGGMLDEAGIASLEDLTADQAQQLIQKKLDEQATLEEQALANQSLQDSLMAFKDAIMNMFTIFEPLIHILTEIVQVFNAAPGWVKIMAAALIGFVAFGPKLAGMLGGFKDMLSGGGKGVLEGVKKKFGFGKSATPEVAGSDSQDMTPQGKGETGLERLSKGLKAMGTDFGTVMKGVLATAVAGPALLLLLPGMPTLLLMAAVGAMGKFVEQGFTSLARGLDAMGQAKGVLKGALALVIVGASLIPFAFALQMLSGVSWKAVLIAVTMMAVGVLALVAIGAIVSGPGGLMLLMGALALVVVGVALMAFGASMLIFAMASEKMQGMDFGWLMDLGIAMIFAGPALLLGGIMAGIAAPFLMVASLGIMAIAMAAQVASGVDWAAFAAMGDALMSIVPGLIGFGFAGLMFLNPLLLLGMILMIGTLSGLAMVMVPLAESLETASDGLHSFADGLDKLQSAANNLDLDKLEMLKDLSMSMAIAGMGGGVMGDSINKIAEALAKLTKVGAGGGGGGGTQKFEINLKLNGRDMQTLIIDDTSIVS